AERAVRLDAAAAAGEGGGVGRVVVDALAAGGEHGGRRLPHRPLAGRGHQVAGLAEDHRAGAGGAVDAAALGVPQFENLAGAGPFDRPLGDTELDELVEDLRVGGPGGELRADPVLP